MSHLVILEKRFENALEKLEAALANKVERKNAVSADEESKNVKKNYHDINDLSVKIAQLEDAAKNDAEEIDRLIGILREILEENND